MTNKSMLPSKVQNSYFTSDGGRDFTCEIGGVLAGSLHINAEGEYEDVTITSLGEDLGYTPDLLIFLYENPGMTEWHYKRAQNAERIVEQWKQKRDRHLEFMEREGFDTEEARERFDATIRDLESVRTPEDVRQLEKKWGNE